MMDDLCHGNVYATTLHVINEALKTLSALSKCQYVYRGVSGGLLPPPFTTGDDIDNFMGGVECTPQPCKPRTFATAACMRAC